MGSDNSGSDNSSEFSEDSFDEADFDELPTNKVNWSEIEVANTAGQNRKLFAAKKNKGERKFLDQIP